MQANANHVHYSLKGRNHRGHLGNVGSRHGVLGRDAGGCRDIGMVADERGRMRLRVVRVRLRRRPIAMLGNRVS